MIEGSDLMDSYHHRRFSSGLLAASWAIIDGVKVDVMRAKKIPRLLLGAVESVEWAS